MLGPDRIVVSCEHGGQQVPRAYARFFGGLEAVLASPRGWDPGALPLARWLARKLRAPLHATTVTRLLVDTNRSLHHRGLFSEFTRPLSHAAREAILERYYLPHRRAIERRVSGWVSSGARVLHLAVHSFDPRLDPERANCDLGLLYDPRRHLEKECCRRWQAALGGVTSVRVRRNFPYRGSADGLTTQLRKQFSSFVYLGIEVEANQDQLKDHEGVRCLRMALESSLGVLRDCTAAPRPRRTPFPKPSSRSARGGGPIYRVQGLFP